MKKHTRILLVALLLALIPLRQFGQQPQQTKLTEFNFHNVQSIEERVFILHSIEENEFFFYRLSDDEGKLDIYVSDTYICEESNANADFDAFSDGRTFTATFMLCDWNTKDEYRACIVSSAPEISTRNVRHKRRKV